MRCLISTFLIWPRMTILLTAPDAGLSGGPSKGLKFPSGPAMVIKSASKFQVIE
jgi:hypothetical protein